MLTERRQRRRRIHPAAPPRYRRLAAYLTDRLPVARLVLRLALSLVAVGHLVLIAFFPGGWNGLLRLDATSVVPHLSYFPVDDAFGFSSRQAQRGFIRYKVFTQEGKVLDGLFPDPRILPDLRFDRWAAAGNVLSGDRPELQRGLLDYLLAHLPSAPIKLELYAGRWVDGTQPVIPGGDGAGDPHYRLTLLGSHDGLTRAWHPGAAKAAK